ncbi:MAG TPA: prepilin-type N-terminal cleavage/methylation domain-containing protein [Candidatus Limnocylindrales bacterium]|nr:prepilin-type N-terminal cleavage/methylation domain-containing protein [Candidatus Limnocylindrales bacterium]
MIPLRLKLSPARLSQAFTLIEISVAIAVGSIVLAAVATLTMYAAKASLALVNYTDLDSKSRYALDVITREIRQSTGLLAYSTNQSAQSLTLTNANQAAAITLTYSPDTRMVVMSKTGQSDLTALTECDTWNFALYQRTPYITSTNVLYYPATNGSGVMDVNLCKLISLSWKCSRTIFAQKVNTESVQAAQIILRSKQ